MNCEYCDAIIPVGDIKCPGCGAIQSQNVPQPQQQPAAMEQAPVAPPHQFAGPPVNCSHCGGNLKKGSTEEGKSGCGCLLILLAILLIGLWPLAVLVFIIGVFLLTRGENYWRCKKCGEWFPR